jgi:hypothetical protein
MYWMHIHGCVIITGERCTCDPGPSRYPSLTSNRVGDYIYLFGFSRGAYSVRTVAGMIEKVSRNLWILGSLWPEGALHIGWVAAARHAQ